MGWVSDFEFSTEVRDARIDEYFQTFDEVDGWRIQRRLVAILAVEVVGYCRMMHVG